MSFSMMRDSRFLLTGPARLDRFDPNSPPPGVTVFRRPSTPPATQLAKTPAAAPAPQGKQVSAAELAAVRAARAQAIAEDRAAHASPTAQPEATKKSGFASRIRSGGGGFNAFRRKQTSG
jgi:hypothetical protein